MEEINYCRTCHSSEENLMFDIFQNDYDKIYKDLTQLPITEDDMYSKLICSKCVNELDNWKDFKEKCINSLDEYFRDVISLKESIDIKTELPEVAESENNLLTVLEIKPEIQESEDDTEKIQERERKYQKFIKENPIEKVGKIFSCSYKNCDKFFMVSDRFESHLRAHFKLNKTSDESLDEKTNLKTKKYKCKKCRYKTYCSINLERHLRINHSVFKNLKCKFCPKTFRKDSRRKLHEEEAHLNGKKQKVELICDHCGQTYMDKYYLKFHIIRAHSKESKFFTCDLCSKNCTTSESLEIHKRTEHNPVICRICKFKCLTKSELITHRKVEHQIESENLSKKICDTCGKKLSSASALRLHEKSHNKEKKFKCKDCNFATTTQFYLDNHTRRIHATSRPFSCDQCDRTYPCESMLKYHQINHTEERNFECPTCNKSFKTEGALRGHKGTHNLHRPFVCGVCNMGFKGKPELKKHSVIHNKSREPVICDLCGRSYSSKRSLKSHKSLFHTTERPFECEKCNMRCKTKAKLRIHMKVHSEVRDIVCTVCGATFKHNASLFNHMKGHKKNLQVESK